MSERVEAIRRVHNHMWADGHPSPCSTCDLLAHIAALTAKYDDEYAAHERTIVMGREEIERLAAENQRLTRIIQETYMSAEKDHRRLFEVLAENERLRADLGMAHQIVFGLQPAPPPPPAPTPDLEALAYTEALEGQLAKVTGFSVEQVRKALKP